MILLMVLTSAATVRRDAHLLGPVGDLVGEGRRRFAGRAHLSTVAADAADAATSTRIVANSNFNAAAVAAAVASALQCGLIALGCGRR